MTKLLAVDTCSKSCSVAVFTGRQAAVELTASAARTHTAHLMQMIHQALEMAESDVGDLDALAVTLGPGSFTGLRIGLATVKGLAFMGRKPVIGVSSLEALAWQGMPWPHAVCAMLDARRGEVYSAVYRARGDRLEREGAERVLSADAVLESAPRPCIFVGDGARLHRERIAAALGENARFAPDERHVIRASSVAALALRQLEGESAGAVCQVVPRYIRRPDAEKVSRSNY
jgi:tRNA threonylcarbamoyladenosine biosynthesis protein TsaB